jgi:hypothetical protein
VRFVDFLKTTVLLSAGAATALAALAVVGGTRDDDTSVLVFCAVWWVLAALAGGWLGRRQETSAPIARLLAGARATTTLPEQRPGTVLLNRLWPLVAVTIVAGGLAFAFPQVTAVAAGFAIIWALSWRRQEAAVTAIEERDGVAFYVERTSPVQPIRLVRTPGFTRSLPA